MAAFNCKLILWNDKKVTYVSANKTEFHAEIVIDDLSKKILNRFNCWAIANKCERPDLELLGELLYSLLLPTQALRKQVENDFEFFLKGRTGKDRFRLTLELHKDARELANYPWEFLFMPTKETASNETGFFLAGEKTELILTRFVPNVPPEINIKTDEPLRILVVFSHPYELPDIKSRITEDFIGDIKKLHDGQRIEVRVEENPTRQILQDLISGPDDPADAAEKDPAKRSQFKPDIFHFIGHGQPGNLALIREPEAILADEDIGLGRIEVDWVPSVEVLRLFDHHTPRLVFLHACDGAKPLSLESLSDLARDLVYARVPVVVAMQYEIKNKEVVLFAKTFYQEISKGSEIDEAVRAGRVILAKEVKDGRPWANRNFGTPVVYLQTDSQRAIIKLPEGKEESREREIRALTSPSDIPHIKVACPNPRCDSPVWLDWQVCVDKGCRSPVMPCPEGLRTRDYHLMLKSAGICGQCGYSEEISGALATPKARGTPDRLEIPPSSQVPVPAATDEAGERATTGRTDSGAAASVVTN